MEIYVQDEFSVLSSVLVIILLSCCWIFLRFKSSSRYAGNEILPPVAPGSWPLIGHLRLLGGSEPLHKTLSKLADKCGPIFLINIGVHPTVVVSNWKISKECLVTHDKVLANRPKAVAAEHLSYNYAMMGFASYGPHWPEVRRISTVELLSNHRLEMLKHVRISEVSAAVKSIYSKWIEKKDSSALVVVDMKDWFGSITMNAMIKLVAGKTWGDLSEDEHDRCQKAIRKWSELMGLFVPADALPFLRWLDIGGHEKAIKRAAQELDVIVQGWLENHKRDCSSAKMLDGQDLMAVMFETNDGGDPIPSFYDTDTVIKATCLAMVLGGTGTSSATLTWALSLLLNNRHLLKKVQDELDAQVGRERQVQESDLKNLTYLQAVVKETLRLHTTSPLGLPHEAISDCCINGYNIPAGTRVFFNLHKIHRDPDVWSDPCEFRPERFLTTHRNVDVGGHNFELIPFGSGRRMCPGISFALRMVQFTLATILHNFDFGSLSVESVDMKEGFGVINLKAGPLDVALTPRLTDSLYDPSNWM